MSKLGNSRYLITYYEPKSPISEAYRAMRTNIDFSSVDDHIQVIMGTSASPGEGKSTTIANIAVVYAQANKKVVLIDADMRKPTMHHTFGQSNRQGLSSLLSRQCELDEAVKATDIPNLYIIPSGPVPPNPSEMVASQRMSALIEELRTKFDIVLIDTPPTLAVTDAQLISTKCDGVLLVVESGKIKRDAVIKAKQQLTHVKARILGVVLKNIEQKNSEGYYYYYYSETEK
ncbi:CpsD/CapB family tyrosine-protein kinase [Paenibacillus sp. CF384]|uniref:CpsD/CapB family tyrosine-protein kinase n=1 Tax=Paenibacillus sp. CF384 TaxID=1884382 RepID=UPI0008989E6C|nr:CpsD/CapB family tyrosine-protein kinase [Paenibacillus sp. CF384]SDX26754.1 capsular exopolysaccharide family [Paenibacillus sp. CF384]